jgi:chemotaxis protein MotB
MKKLILGIMALALLSSCVSKKKFLAMQSEKESLENALNMSKKSLTDCEDAKTKLMSDLDGKSKDLNTANGKIKTLEDQIDFVKKSNTNLLQRLQDLSIVSQSGAESIKKSLDAMNEKDKYIKDLTTSMQKKDSLNLSLVMNLKRSLSGASSEDVEIVVKKGVVFISLSDKMLFQSGSANINKSAESVLANVSKVLNDRKDLDIIVEGHTDNVPVKLACMSDNWDLSARRATAVVRLLQKKYNVAPERMTAGGRSEYVPKASNDTAEGKKANRRTEIIITPKLDQFFDLMSPQK